MYLVQASGFFIAIFYAQGFLDMVFTFIQVICLGLIDDLLIRGAARGSFSSLLINDLVRQGKVLLNSLICY